MPSSRDFGGGFEYLADIINGWPYVVRILFLLVLLVYLGVSIYFESKLLLLLFGLVVVLSFWYSSNVSVRKLKS
jgi:hypothetical protein